MKKLRYLPGLFFMNPAAVLLSAFVASANRRIIFLFFTRQLPRTATLAGSLPK
jgi:hypothetical protein